MHQPYTYYLEWNTGKKYYGVRYGKNCRPGELFETYFTSSTYVKSYIEKHGKPNIIQIRKLFIDNKKARAWEHTVLRRLNVTKRNDYLNKSTTIGWDNTDIEVRRKMSESKKGKKNPQYKKAPWNKGKTKYTDVRLLRQGKAISATKKRNPKPSPNKGRKSKYKGIPRTDKVKAKISATKQGHTVSEETRKKLSKYFKDHTPTCAYDSPSPETRKKMSNIMKNKKWFTSGEQIFFIDKDSPKIKELNLTPGRKIK